MIKNLSANSVFAGIEIGSRFNTRPVIGRFALAVCSLLFAGCAGSPVALSHMTDDELHSVEGTDLCKAYGSYYSSSSKASTKPNLNREVARRGISCANELEYYVSDCGQLEILKVTLDPVDPKVIHFTVNNKSSKIKRFNIAKSDGGVSGTATINPNSTIDITVANNSDYGKAINTALQLKDLITGASAEYKLNQCYTRSW